MRENRISLGSMMNPAKTVIEKCGGVKAVAGVVRKSETRVRRWTYPKARGGTDGLVPSACQVDLLAHARKVGIALGPADFFPAELVCVDGSDTSHAYTPAPSDGKPQENEVSNARGVTP